MQERYGVPREALERLESLEVLTPRVRNGAKRYGPDDVQIIEAIGRMRASGYSEALGFTVYDTLIYKRNLERMVHEEVETMMDRVAGEMDTDAAADLSSRPSSRCRTWSPRCAPSCWWPSCRPAARPGLEPPTSSSNAATATGTGYSGRALAGVLIIVLEQLALALAAAGTAVRARQAQAATAAGRYVVVLHARRPRAPLPWHATTSRLAARYGFGAGCATAARCAASRRV